MSRPSRQDERSPGPDGAPGLLARVRRRLPPEVDIVELPAPGVAEAEDMTRLAKVAGPLLAGAVALSGCSPALSTIRATTAKSKADVIEVSRDVLDGLTAVSRPYGPVEGQWRGCRDKAGWVQYFVEGRMDPLPAVADGLPLGDQAAAVLESRGYPLAVVDDDRGVRTMEHVTGDINIQVTGYRDEPYVVLDISGGCIEVAERHPDYRYESPTPLL